MYKMREERDIKPSTFGHMVSAMLYEKRRVDRGAQSGGGTTHRRHRLPWAGRHVHPITRASSHHTHTHTHRRFGPYFVEPVVAGLDADGKPFITAMDLIGAAPSGGARALAFGY